MNKKNCWEFKNCKDKLNCPAYKESRLDGVHGGYKAGRSCWIIAGTLCGGIVQGRFAQKTATCLGCDFYGSVYKEERKDFIGTQKLLDKLK